MDNITTYGRGSTIKTKINLGILWRLQSSDVTYNWVHTNMLIIQVRPIVMLSIAKYPNDVEKMYGAIQKKGDLPHDLMEA